MRELRFAARRLWTDRWFGAAAVISAGCGAAVATAVFAVTYGVLLRPLPYQDAARLAVLDLTIPLDRFPDWRARIPAFTLMTAYARSGFTVRGIGDPSYVPTAMVEGPFFETLGTRPAAGRTFTEEDGPLVAVVSDRFARRAAGSPAGVLARTMTVGDHPVTIVGVMPATFAFPSDAIDVWIPARAAAGVVLGDVRDERGFGLLGRLAVGARLGAVTAQEARARAELGPRSGSGNSSQPVETLRDRIVGPARPLLAGITAATLLVLLVACANVSTILLSRTIGRRRELAVRAALGASRRALLATVIWESLILFAAAGAAGVWLASLAVAGARSWAAGVLPRVADIRLDWPILAASVAFVLLGASLAALPAASAIEPSDAALRSAAGNSGRGARFRSVLTALQIATAVVLLSAATLLVRTVHALLDADTGMRSAGLLVSQLMLSDSLSFDAAGRQEWLTGILSDVRAVPGVESAGAGSSLPPDNGTLAMTLRIVDEKGSRESPEITVTAATPGYLEALGTTLQRGRYLTEADESSDTPVAILSRAAARVLVPDREAVGSTIRLPGRWGRTPARVVGLVSDIKYTGLAATAGPAVYIPWHAVPASQVYLAVRARGDPRPLAPTVRAAIHAGDPRTPLLPIRTFDEVMAQSIADRRLRAGTVGGASLVAFAIALVGLAAALGRLVRERRRELAIRAALGASRSRTIATVMANGAMVVTLGVAGGTSIAWAAAGFIRGVLYGVAPHDPRLFAIVGGAVAAISLLMCYLPARAAAGANPVDLLRSE